MPLIRFAHLHNTPVPPQSHFSLEAILLTHLNLHGSVLLVLKILQRTLSNSICGRSLDCLSSGAVPRLKVFC